MLVYLYRLILTGYFACRLVHVDNFAFAAFLASKLSLVILVFRGRARGAHPGCAAKRTEIAAAARGCALLGRRLADGALDTARKIWMVLATIPPARAELAFDAVFIILILSGDTWKARGPAFGTLIKSFGTCRARIERRGYGGRVSIVVSELARGAFCACRAGFAEFAGRARSTRRRSLGLGRRADRANMAFGHLGFVGKVVDRAQLAGAAVSLVLVLSGHARQAGRLARRILVKSFGARLA